jgi:hypothetical protein
MTDITEMNHSEPTRHNAWQDRVMLMLGVVIFLSSMFFPVTAGLVAPFTTMLVGGLIALLGAMELVYLRHWEEFMAFLAGLWMIASPFAFDYADPLRHLHIALGIIVALLAAIEIWQDRNRRFAE